MPHEIVLAVMVLASDASDASTIAAIDAARTAIGPDAILSVTPFAERPTDDDVAKFGVKSDATVVLTWSDDHRRAHLHLLRIADKTWIDRDIGFDPHDAPRERGRTLGFAIATMMPGADDNGEPPPPAWGAQTAPPGGSRATEPATAPRAPTLPRDYRGTVTAVGIAATGIGGYGGGGGGGLALEWYAGRWLGIRLSFAGRAAEVGPAAATAYTVSGGLGARARVLARGPFELGLRCDMQVLWQELSHLDADDPGPRHQSRFLPAATAMADLSWSFTESASAVLGLGTEVAFGQTDLYLRDQNVATLVPVRLVSELGFRVRF